MKYIHDLVWPMEYIHDLVWPMEYVHELVWQMEYIQTLCSRRLKGTGLAGYGQRAYRPCCWFGLFRRWCKGNLKFVVSRIIRTAHTQHATSVHHAQDWDRERDRDWQTEIETERQMGGGRQREWGGGGRESKSISTLQRILFFSLTQFNTAVHVLKPW